MLKKSFLSFFVCLALAFSPFHGRLQAAEIQQVNETPPADGTLIFGIKPVSPENDSAAKNEKKEKRMAGITKLEIKEARDDAGEFQEEFKEEGEDLVETPDPYENFNRTMFRFNDFLYEEIMEPVSTVYYDVTEKDFRTVVKNLFNHIKMPIRLVSSVLQGNGEKAVRTLERFVINTAFCGGLVDVAKTEFHIEEVEEDFDQALGSNGVKTGPYFVWPLIGPSTARATVGGIIDGLMNPIWLAGPGAAAEFGVGTMKKINDTATSLDVKEEIDDMAIDSYLSVRDLYLQYRKGKLEE